MNYKKIEETLCGAICLIVGWGSATILHECFHLMTASALGLPASLGKLTFTTGSVFVSGDMTNIETALVAVAGSIGLITIGVLLVRLSSNPAARMVGIIFLCRAWIDALPLCDLDGAIMAEGAGWLIAWTVVIAEILICGGMIWYTLNNYPDTHQHTEVE